MMPVRIAWLVPFMLIHLGGRVPIHMLPDYFHCVELPRRAGLEE